MGADGATPRTAASTGCCSGASRGRPTVPDSQAVKDDDYVAKILGLLDELGGPSPEVSVVAADAPARRAAGRPASSRRASSTARSTPSGAARPTPG